MKRKKEEEKKEDNEDCEFADPLFLISIDG